MDIELTTRETTPRAAILPADPTSRDQRHRLTRYARWLDGRGEPWHAVDLAAYRDDLLGNPMRASSAGAHLATVRARYKELLRDGATRDELYTLAGERLAALDQDDTPANRKAFVDELVTRIESALDPRAAPVKTVTRQDRPDREQLRLTGAQASALLASPGLATVKGVRDTAILGLMLCTGVREAELRALDVADLRQHLGGELALHVREGKGCKERLVPYGDLDWILAVVDRWLALAGIESGPVFRGLYRGDGLRPGRLSLRAIEYIAGRYPVTVGGEVRHVKPHDLRRTYARRLYESGVDTVAIKQNLGHKSLKTTLGYIGELDAARRRAPALYQFDLAGLFEQGKLIDQN